MASADHTSGGNEKSKRGPPITANYEFTFTIPRTMDIEDPAEGKTVVYYLYEITIRRTDDSGKEKIYHFPSSPGDALKYKKRWSEIDAFDAEWAARMHAETGSSVIHDQLALGMSLNKTFSAFMSSSALKAKRTQRFHDYIYECMSEPKLGRELARFLLVPMEILMPTVPSDAKPKPASNASSPTSGGPERRDEHGDVIDEKPIQYTHRKIKRKKVLPEGGQSDSEEEQEVPAAAAATAAIHSGIVQPVASGGINGGIAPASSSTSSFSPMPMLTPSKSVSSLVKVPSQYHRDGVTPNEKWLGPSYSDWIRLKEEGVPLLKLPHSSGFLSSGKPKIRKFWLLPLATSDKAQATIKAAKATSKKNASFFAGVHDGAYILLWDSSKSDILETFFILGDKDIPWNVIYDQSEFHKKSNDPAQEALSLTIKYRDGSELKTLDLIAEHSLDYDLIKKALTFVRWKEQGILKAFNDTGNGLLSNSPAPINSASPVPVGMASPVLSSSSTSPQHSRTASASVTTTTPDRAITSTSTMTIPTTITSPAVTPAYNSSQSQAGTPGTPPVKQYFRKIEKPLRPTQR